MSSRNRDFLDDMGKLAAGAAGLVADMLRQARPSGGSFASESTPAADEALYAMVAECRRQQEEIKKQLLQMEQRIALLEGHPSAKGGSTDRRAKKLNPAKGMSQKTVKATAVAEKSPKKTKPSQRDSRKA